MDRRALIIGHTGQDGLILSTILAKKGFEIYGISRSKVSPNFATPKNGIKYSVCDFEDLKEAIKLSNPDHIYYLAAVHQSSSDVTLDESKLIKDSFEINVIGISNVLELCKIFSPRSKIFYAASSHIFGIPPIEPQNESVCRNPLGIYGITKSAGLSICEYYREKYGLCASVGILYNHESEFRQKNFVTSKIVHTAVDIKLGKANKLELGNLDSRIDWGMASDYMEAAFMINNAAKADTYVIGSGISYSILDFVNTTFDYLGLNWTDFVDTNPNIVKKEITFQLRADNSKLKNKLGWTPKYSFENMVHHLVDCQLKNS